MKVLKMLFSLSKRIFDKLKAPMPRIGAFPMQDSEQALLPGNDLAVHPQQLLAGGSELRFHIVTAHPGADGIAGFHDALLPSVDPSVHDQIGRASCRERV